MKQLSDTQIRRARAILADGKGIPEALADTVPVAVGVHDVLGVRRQLRAAIGGAGPILQPLLEDPQVTDILVNGVHGVWIDRGRGLEAVAVSTGLLDTPQQVRDLAVRLAAASGQRLDDASPIVDGTLEGGLRLHAVLPPLAWEGPFISLRSHRAVTLSLDELVASGTVPVELAAVLVALLNSHANVMISGATGSGKTTLLSALLSQVSAAERILIIEEAAELRPRHPHAIHLQVRHANVQGSGEVGMVDLVRAALRMRPDRIVLGECRGAEVREVLSALNTGHEGGWATVHANSAHDVPARLVALGALAGMTEAVVAAQAASALDAVIHIDKNNGQRCISQVATLERRGDELVTCDALKCVDGEEGQRRVVPGPGWPRLARRLALRESI
ncbi:MULTISPECIES: TadA family conjugal transfer-associated ATPase [unclassified Actinobaculum]|uniref:TadA family conjugal transfer-associated ATPase n=1 Tax=unclassified Actinobaculum TaxID=2609299 RepID=UPI000D5289DB|nr:MULTISPECIES: TadA family conjugal transfer-associated ATPase [unclassified Actinobaculum]AWE41613.1 pilus assembly protein CpaF [Actinobaculum sp. 313]RTE49233.1 TadA family conjugal transfer-associated ATPase [Actinobaculum sp. 352]